MSATRRSGVGSRSERGRVAGPGEGYLTRAERRIVVHAAELGRRLWWALGRYEYERPQDYPLLTWEQARPMLDYTYDAGFGGHDCHDVYVWTASRVLFIHEYDGATSVNWLPGHQRRAIRSLAASPAGRCFSAGLREKQRDMRPMRGER